MTMACMETARLILIIVIRFMVVFVLAMFILALPFALLVAGSDGDVTVWQGIAVYLACAMLGMLEVLMYLRRRKRAKGTDVKIDSLRTE